MPAENLAAAAFLVQATLPQPTLAELWTLAHNSRTPEQPWTLPPPGADLQREAVQPWQLHFNSRGTEV